MRIHDEPTIRELYLAVGRPGGLTAPGSCAFDLEGESPLTDREPATLRDTLAHSETEPAPPPSTDD